MNAICITKYHAYLVGFISTKSIVFTKSTETSLNKLINLIKMIISRDEVLISHPFSLMTVIFFSFKKIILLDDGLAYYYKSPAPSNLTGYFYRVIILITHGVWVRSFLDLIHLKNVQSCYLVAPEYLFTDSRPIKIPIKKININTGFIKEKYANGLVLDQELDQ